jgi:hypothetical protein
MGLPTVFILNVSQIWEMLRALSETFLFHYLEAESGKFPCTSNRIVEVYVDIFR